MTIRILNKQEIQQIFPMQDAVRAVKEALAYYSAGQCQIPLRINVDVPTYNGQTLYMPGYVPAADAQGVKIVSIYPQNIQKGLTGTPATMVLLNNETGEVCSILDGTYLTQLRTGAMAGAAIDLLARSESSVFALFGTGGQAESQLVAALTMRPIKEVQVFDVSHERACSFIDKMQPRFPHIDFQIAATPTDAIRNADIITCATTSKKPVFDGRVVKIGAHINGIGSYMPAMQELDEYIISRANKVYVDTRHGVLSEAGDFLIPIRKGLYQPELITGELGELLIQKVPGRENTNEITLFKATGSAVLDVVVARHIYQKAVDANSGYIITF